MNDAPPAPDLADLFRRIAYALCEVVAGHFVRDRSSGPMLELITKSLFSKMRRFAALVGRYRAGAIFPPLKPRRRAARSDATALDAPPAGNAASEGASADAVPPPSPGAATKPALHLPRKKAWLTVMMPWVVALYAIRLRAFVEDPETAAFLAACPQARAMLRDLWWALSSDPLPDILRPDVAAAAAPAEPNAEPAPAARARRAAPDGSPAAPLGVIPRGRPRAASRARRRSFSPA